jgi:hypothetical protein
MATLHAHRALEEPKVCLPQRRRSRRACHHARGQRSACSLNLNERNLGSNLRRLHQREFLDSALEASGEFAKRERTSWAAMRERVRQR